MKKKFRFLSAKACNSAEYFKLKQPLKTLIFCSLSLASTGIVLAVLPQEASAATYNNTSAGTISNSATSCASPLIRTFNVTENSTIQDVNLGFNANHSYRGDIQAVLVHPDRTRVTVIADSGDDNNIDYDVLLDSNSSNPLNDGSSDNTGTPLYERTASPSNSLNSFNGKNSNGIWRIEICDVFSADNGRFNSAQLNILTASAGVSGFAFDDVNENTVRDNSEGILSNIGVSAYRDDGDGIYEPGAGDTLVGTRQTDTTGQYAFSGLSNGNYWIDVDETDTDLAGRSYGGSAATNTDDPRLVTYSGTPLANVDFPFVQDLTFLCEPGDPTENLSFLQGAALEAGTALQVGARYRFSDVFQNVDALVEVSAFNGGATLGAIDNDTTGVASAFQPTLSAVQNTTSSVDFIITLVEKNTTTPIALTFRASGVDVDGDGSALREFIELTNLNGFRLSANTTLTATAIASGNRFESNTPVAQPGVSATATNAVVVAEYISVSQLRYRIGAIAGATTATQRLNSLYFGCTAGPVVSNPNVRLVKRITAINGDRTQNPNDSTALNTVVNDNIADSADDESNWPDNYLLGQLNAGLVKPGDEVEYTVYFLNSGSGSAEDVRICDWIQPNQRFVPGRYGGNDIELVIGGTTYSLTAASDATTTDRAELTTVGNLPAGPTCNLSTAATNASDEVVVLDVTGTSGDPTGLATFPGTTGQGTPNNAFGLFRFTTQVDE